MLASTKNWDNGMHGTKTTMMTTTGLGVPSAHGLDKTNSFSVYNAQAANKTTERFVTM